MPSHSNPHFALRRQTINSVTTTTTSSFIKSASYQLKTSWLVSLPNTSPRRTSKSISIQGRQVTSTCCSANIVSPTSVRSSLYSDKKSRIRAVKLLSPITMERLFIEISAEIDGSSVPLQPNSKEGAPGPSRQSEPPAKAHTTSSPSRWQQQTLAPDDAPPFHSLPASLVLLVLSKELRYV